MRARFVPIALVLLLLGAACGGGDDSKVITEAKLQGYLLSEKDLPTGFEQQKVEEDEEEAEDDSCLGGADDVPTVAEASAEFLTTDGATQISHDVEGYEAGKAQEAMAAGRDVLERCSSFEEEIEGTTMKGTVGAVDGFPNLGDETVAFTLQATVSNFPINGLIVVVRSGDIITGVTYIASNAPVVRSVVEDLARKAVDKLA